MIFIDANIWCYYIDARLPEHHRVVPSVRKALTEDSVAINTVVAMELAHYLSRNMDGAATRETMRALLNLGTLKIIDFDKRLLNESIGYLSVYSGSHGLGGRDATIIASILGHGIGVLYTHERGLASLCQELGITIHDPVL